MIIKLIIEPNKLKRNYHTVGVVVMCGEIDYFSFVL